jgi:signal peptidase I
LDTTAAPLQDQLANISPLWVVVIVTVFTMIRVALRDAKDSWARTVSEICDTINFVLVLAFLLIQPFVCRAFYIPSESMESTLLVGDRLMVNKFLYRFSEPQRGDVIVFEAPPNAPGARPGQSVDYIKRLIAVPGDKLRVTKAKLVLNGQEVDYSGEAGDLHDYLRRRLGLRDEITQSGKRLQDAIRVYSDYVLVKPFDGRAPYKISKEKVAEQLGQPGATVSLTPGKVYLNGKVQDEPYINEDPDYNFPDDVGSELTVEPGKYYVMGDNRNHSADSRVWGQLEKHRVVGKAAFIFFPFTRFGAIK